MIVQRCKGHKYVLLLTLVFMLVACNSTENDTVSEGGDGTDVGICNDVSSDLSGDWFKTYQQVPQLGGRDNYWSPVDFSWSPDGQKLVYRNGANELYWLNIDEKKVHRLLSVHGTWPTWAHDSQRIAFVANETVDFPLVIVDVPSGEEAVTPYRTLSDPMWTDDGHYIRFLSDIGVEEVPSRQLYEVKTDDLSQEPTQIFLDPIPGMLVSWSAYDPNEFVVWGDDIIFMGNLDGKELVQLTDVFGCDQFPVWSPVDNRLVYISDQTRNWDIFLLNTTNGIGTEENLTNSPAQEYHPSWSPDGQYVAFTRFEPTGRNEVKQDIFVMNVETREIRQLTDTPDELESYPQWSPDGQALAFVTLSQEQWYIDLVDLRTNERSRIITIGPEIQDDER